MSYKITIRRKAQKQLAGLSVKDYLKIKQAILSLANDPRPSGSQKLKGRNGWRIRKGNFRIIYEIEDAQLVVVVLDVGDRKDIYK